jgi:hypothetical protein
VGRPADEPDQKITCAGTLVPRVHANLS